jgi:hypothetical protein
VRLCANLLRFDLARVKEELTRTQQERQGVVLATEQQRTQLREEYESLRATYEAQANAERTKTQEEFARMEREQQDFFKANEQQRVQLIQEYEQAKKIFETLLKLYREKLRSLKRIWMISLLGSTSRILISKRPKRTRLSWRLCA